MKTFLLTFSFLILGLLPGFSCLNEHGVVVDDEGVKQVKVITDPFFFVMPVSGHELIEASSKSKDLVELLAEQTTLSDSIKIVSDLGAQYIKLGKFDLAITLYKEIEKVSPNRYRTASNIGTAYELTGQIDSALFWINKGIKLNNQSHDGSEWIHRKILEHKLSGQPVTGSFLDIGGKEFSSKEIVSQLKTQLKERTIFVTSQNQWLSYSLIMRMY